VTCLFFLIAILFLQSSRLDNANDDMAMVKEIRQIASSANFTTIVFNPFFTYIDLVNFWPPLNTERIIFLDCLD